MGLDITTKDQSNLTLTLRPEFEYGLFIISGDAAIEGKQYTENELIYLGSNLNQVSLQLSADSHALLLGGEPLNEDVLMWWNFIGRTKVEITRAIEEWNQGNSRFGKVINDDRTPTLSPLMP